MKNRIIVLITFMVLGSGLVNAQVNEYKKQKSIYTRAITYSDFDVARMALFNMMEMRPNSNGLLDTLSLLYFERQQYLSAAITAQEGAQRNPNNTLALEIAGVSFENLGLIDKALENYENLYTKNTDINTLYKMGFLQYRLKRYNDALVSADIIIKDVKSKDLQISFGKKDQSTQNVSMEAAAYRLKALIALDKEDKELSIQHFKKALEINPEFEVVSQAIKEVQSK